MKQVLKTTLLEYDKSTFLIDLVEHESEKLYISILQTIPKVNMPAIKQEIKINPSILSDLLIVLASYQKYLPASDSRSYGHLTNASQAEIVKRYLKGVSLKDLAMQFDFKLELIEQVLRNKGIEIVPDQGLNQKSTEKRNRK